MGLTLGIETITDALFNTTFAGQNWIIMLTILTASLMLITRKYQDWATLLLPVTMGWKYFGMPVPLIFLVISGIIFVVDIVSMKLLVGSFEGISEMLTATGRLKIKLRKAQREARPMDIREKIEELKGKESGHEIRMQEKILKRTSPEEYDMYMMRKQLKKRAREQELMEKEYPILKGKKKKEPLWTEKEVKELMKEKYQYEG